MQVALEGGCFVTGLKDGEPEQRGSLRIWRQIHRGTGATAISLRVLEFAKGMSPTIRNPPCDDVLYVVEGEGTLVLDGQPHDAGPDIAIYVRPNASFAVQNAGSHPLTIVSSQCPDPGPMLDLGAETQPSGSSSTARPILRLEDRAQESTADRWYRVLIDKELGCRQTTQFVGGIPPGRAPDHFHNYEEVLCILRGTGRMWAGQSNTPIKPGSCIFLPRGQVHCVENIGSGELRLLGVFHPAGSPADRHSADARDGSPSVEYQASRSR